ncbi:MAG: hypothetical protein LUC98_10050 [Lachnospiraceae bacterium]|nr:hypothetical protein [Lachnospiraceae bacterium]
MAGRRFLFIMMLALMLAALGGCSSGGGTSSDSQTESAGSAQTGEEARSVLVGTISGITDGVFTVTDQDGIPYDFYFEGEAPDGLEDVTEGAYVKVVYTGDLSETDGFDGEVVSVEEQ